MRKDIKSNKVVKALALGLATSMLLAQPLSASADELEAASNDSTVDNDPTVEESKDVAEDSKFEDVENAIEDAQDAIKAAEAVVEPEQQTQGTEPDPEDTTTLQDAEEAMTSAEADIITTDTYQNAANADVEDANVVLGQIEENNDVIAEQSAAADEAVAKADEALAEAKAATTKDAAQAAVDKAEEAVEEAKAAQEAAQAAYDENVEKLDEAKLELEAAKANLEAAQSSFDATKEDVAAAEKLLEQAEKEAAELEAQVAADKKAVEDSKEGVLKTAYDKMVAEKITKTYTGEAATAPDEDPVDGIGDEFSDEFGSESAKAEYWDAADEYFELYLQYIYGDSYVGGKWTRKNTLNNDEAYNAARDNTFTVTYRDEDGNEQTAYYNYHTSIDPEKKGEITIYEKEIATGNTEEVWSEFTSNVEVIQGLNEEQIQTQEKSNTTSEDALSIKHIDEEGNETYTKLADVQGEDDVVLTTGTDEAGNATSVLVKDANSTLIDEQRVNLADNQQVVDGSATDTYEVETILVEAAYGTKEVRVDYTDRLGSYNSLKSQYDAWVQEYPEADGYRIEIVYDHGFGNDEVITLEEASEPWREANSVLGSIMDCGFELKVYQTVEDTDNVTEWAEQQVIVKTTTAEVETTETGKTNDDGYSSKKKAQRAMENEIARLEAEGYTILSSSYYLGWSLYEYEIEYSKTTTSTQTIKTETYSGTAYETNTIETTTTWTEYSVLVTPAQEYEYWTERRNTSHDADVDAAIEAVEAKLNDVKAKQEEAAKAAEAVKAAADAVDAAKAELEKVSVSSEAYDVAVKNYEDALDKQAQAEDALKGIAEEVEKAEETYKDAAAELGRFVPAPSSNPVEDTTPDEVEPEVEPEAEPEVEPEAEPEAEPEVEPEAEVEAEPEAEAEETVEIEDEDTPLAQGTDAAEEADEDAAADETVEIADEETPLASGSADVKEGPMSWWWLLIVAALGATGYEMYRRHNLKKAEKEADDK